MSCQLRFDSGLRRCLLRPCKLGSLLFEERHSISEARSTDHWCSASQRWTVIVDYELFGELIDCGFVERQHIQFPDCFLSFWILHNHFDTDDTDHLVIFVVSNSVIFIEFDVSDNFIHFEGLIELACLDIFQQFLHLSKPVELVYFKIFGVVKFDELICVNAKQADRLVEPYIFKLFFNNVVATGFINRLPWEELS